MRLIVEDRTFDTPTEQLITSGLAVLPRAEGVAILEDGDSFLQARRQGDEFEVEYRDAAMEQLFETATRFDVKQTTKLFLSYFSAKGEWSSNVQWVPSSWNAASAGSKDPDAAHHAILNASPSYENPELVAVRANIERLRDAGKNAEKGLPDSSGAHDASTSAVRCSRCGSEQVTGARKGYGAGKGIVGLLIAGPVGLLAGLLGRKTLIVSCLSCGHAWRAGSWFR